MNTIIGMVLVLGVLILVHEWGHYIVARFFGVRVDVFSIGFGPRLFGIKRGATDWRVSALPLGGYVRMAGQDITDIDSGDQKPTGAPDELMSKPRWQRALICAAGPAVNLIFPIFLLTGYYVIKGEALPKYEQDPLVVVDLQKDSPLAKAGVVHGDRIISVDGIANPTWETAQNVVEKSPAGQTYQLTIDHQGVTRALTVSSVGMKSPELIFGFPPDAPAVVSDLDPSLPAKAAGVKVGDTIVAVDGEPVASWGAFVDAIQQGQGKPVNFVVRRDGQLVNLSVTPQKGKNELGETAWMVGIHRSPGKPEVFFRKISFEQALAQSCMMTWRGTQMVVDVVDRLVSGKTSPKELQSVVGIASLAGKAVEAGSFAVVQLMAVLSVNLGILNILPIPILDGGQILLLSLEGIRRRDFSLAFKERFIQVGLVFLLVLIAYVTYNDVARMLIRHS
ncbi:MAG: RIP metalloprotease RseP [Candidatus Acidiferrum sp.]